MLYSGVQKVNISSGEFREEGRTFMAEKGRKKQNYTYSNQVSVALNSLLSLPARVIILVITTTCPPTYPSRGWINGWKNRQMEGGMDGWKTQ